MGCKQNSANITPTLGLGSVDSPYFVQVNISQRLCSPACESQTPVFAPTFSLVGYSEVGAGQYVATIKVEGIISYACSTGVQPLSQTFTVPFASATAPTSVTVASGVSKNSIIKNGCKSHFVSETPITITVA